ncbi:LysR family transcriptional regulator [Propionivibrio limicola]|uniref:LysR family transcriptional regulator n=1 Tax=Propionivibrio limicola TaxID=167645 RepID=UPI0012922C4A|nr:LysR family transcriptional regulator [Propionivibrio limicola]
MINPQWLHTFTTLIELGSFTRAGERLGVTQAAVSLHVRHLEEKFGTLFIRRPRQLELTPTGKTLAEYCREIDQVNKRFELRLSETEADCGEITLTSPGSIGLAVYPLLLDLQAAHPGLTVRHRFAPDPEVLEAVVQNRYELGLMTYRPDDVRIAASLFAEEALELVVPAGKDVQVWADLERIGFIDHPDGQAMASRLLSRIFPGNAGIRHIPCHGFINHIGMILEPVARGLGFAVIPQYARQAFARQEAIRVVIHPTTVIDTLWLIHRAEWPLSARAGRAVEFLRQRIGEKHCV